MDPCSGADSLASARQVVGQQLLQHLLQIAQQDAQMPGGSPQRGRDRRRWVDLDPLLTSWVLWCVTKHSAGKSRVLILVMTRTPIVVRGLSSSDICWIVLSWMLITGTGSKPWNYPVCTLVGWYWPIAKYLTLVVRSNGDSNPQDPDNQVVEIGASHPKSRCSSPTSCSATPPRRAGNELIFWVRRIQLQMISSCTTLISCWSMH